MNKFAIIDENQFNLGPVLAAAQTRSPIIMQDCFDQGYRYSWCDHQSHKTLYEVLGEQFDLATIQFLNTLIQTPRQQYLNQAVMGAAFANRSLSEINSISPLDMSNAHAMKGAAKGMHRNLLNEIRKAIGEERVAMNAHFIMLGAAMANDQALLSSCYYASKSNNTYLLLCQIRGATRGGHLQEVKKLLERHFLWGEGAIKVFGKSIAYSSVCVSAASMNNMKLIAETLNDLNSRQSTMEYPPAIIIECLSEAAFHGHRDLVFNCLNVIKSFCRFNDAEQCYKDGFKSAIQGAIEGNRIKLATQLIQSNPDIETVASAITGAKAPLFRSLNNPELCYTIAYLHDNLHTSIGTERLAEIVNQVFQLTPMSESANQFYFRCLEETKGTSQDLAKTIGQYVTDPNVEYSDLCAVILHLRQVRKHLTAENQANLAPEQEATHSSSASFSMF